MKAVKLKPEWPPSTSRVLKPVVAILLLTNLLLLLALFQANISQELRIDSELPCSTRTPLRVLSPTHHTALYPVTLDTSNLSTALGELRTFKAHGIASHLLIEFGAYRTSPNKFSVVAVISKRFHDLHDPPYTCSWRFRDKSHTTTTATNTWPIKPDWNLGTMYGTLVVVCTFNEDVGSDGSGGELVLTVGYSDGFRPPESFVALRELPGEYNASKWAPPFPYEITLCVSRLYGDVNPQRIREWLAYHALLFGNGTHFLFHDAGGVTVEVFEVLKPWMERGWVSLQDLKGLEVYEGRSHHQFTMLNDCMLRAQRLSNWTFFFDVDEYLFVPGERSLREVLVESEGKRRTQIRMKTVKMSDALCSVDPYVDDTTRDANNISYEEQCQFEYFEMVFNHIREVNVNFLGWEEFQDFRGVPTETYIRDTFSIDDLIHHHRENCGSPGDSWGAIAEVADTKFYPVHADECQSQFLVITKRKWAFEKLVYANCNYGWEPMETRKYALQPREAIATGVHMCEYMKGGAIWDPDESELRLYHYHATIPVKGEVCREFTSGTDGSWFTNCTVDRTMTPLAAKVKQFEIDTLGKQPFMELA